jgi:hypothetical protein
MELVPEPGPTVGSCTLEANTGWTLKITPTLTEYGPSGEPGNSVLQPAGAFKLYTQAVHSGCTLRLYTQYTKLQR